MGKELFCLRGSTKNLRWGCLGNIRASKAGVDAVEGAQGRAVSDGFREEEGTLLL